MQSPIWSKDHEQFVWSDEIKKFTISPVPDLQIWLVRAYRDEDDFVSMGEFGTREEAREFVLCSMLEMIQPV